MSIDSIISTLNIFTISACICAIATWWPSFLRYFGSLGKWENPSRIYWMAAGIVEISAGTMMVRLYSFSMREFGMLWLRDTHYATAGVSVQMIGFASLAYAYFAPTRQKDLTPDNYLGIWAGAAALVLLMIVKIIT